MRSHKGFRPIVIIFFCSYQLTGEHHRSPVASRWKEMINVTGAEQSWLPNIGWAYLYMFSLFVFVFIWLSKSIVYLVCFNYKYWTRRKISNESIVVEYKNKIIKLYKKAIKLYNKVIKLLERKNWHLQVFLKVSTNLVIDAIAKCYRRKHVRHKV